MDSERRYCRGCGYDLRQLPERRCPECGRGFDPADRRTYARQPRSSLRRWIIRLGLLLVLCAMVPAGGVGWVWWQWSSEQKAIAALRALDARITVERQQPRGLERYLPQRLHYLLDRAVKVESCADEKGDQAMEQIARLTALREVRVRDLSSTGMAGFDKLHELTLLEIYSARIDDASLVHLAHLSKLQRLEMWDSPISDAGLVHLARLNRLKHLELHHGRIIGNGLSHLTQLPLDVLDLSGSPLKDEGLRHIGQIQSLGVLWLNGTKITDAGMGELSRLRGLRMVQLMGTAITDSGVAHLRGIPRLYNVNLRQTGVTDAVVEHLLTLPMLGAYDLRETRVTREGFTRLRKQNFASVQWWQDAVVPTTVPTTRPRITWDCEFIIKLQREAIEILGRRKRLDKDRPEEELRSLEKHLRQRLSPEQFDELVESFATMPYPELRTATPLAQAALGLVRDTSDPDKLIKFLSIYCPPELWYRCNVELSILYTDKLIDGILLFPAAYKKAQRPDTRKNLAQAMRRAFIGHGIDDPDDDKLVARAARWYIENREHLTLNHRYDQNAYGNVDQSLEPYKENPLFVRKDTTPPLRPRP